MELGQVLPPKQAPGMHARVRTYAHTQHAHSETDIQTPEHNPQAPLFSETPTLPKHVFRNPARRCLCIFSCFP